MASTRKPRNTTATQELAAEAEETEDQEQDEATATRVATRAGARAKKGSASKKGSGSSKPATTPPASAEEDIAAALGYMPGMLGGSPRQTLPTNANIFGNMPYAFMPRRSYQNVDLTTLGSGNVSSQQLLELLADAWPELGLALWNFMRLAAQGWKYEVRTPDDKREDAAGKAALDEVLTRVNPNWGGFAQIINQWVMSTVLQGACCGECVPTPELDDVWDIVPVQPWSIYFQRGPDQRYVAYQWQPMTIAAAGSSYASAPNNDYGFTLLVPDPSEKAPPPMTLLNQEALKHGGFRHLNEVTFGYVPLDADVDDPYGRSPFAPVLQLVAWDAQMLKDLRQWSHVNAFGRVDVKVVADMAINLMPPAIQNDAKQRRAFLRKYLADIQTAYNQLNPDDTYVHYDNVEVAASDASGKTFDVDKLIRVIERRVFRGLKQLPILMGSNEGTTETWGTLQMEVYALGVKNIQRVVASLVEKLLNVALRLRGFQSVVKFEFETLRASDRFKEAQADELEIKNAAAMRDEGWITQDDASIRVTGSKAVAEAPQPDSIVAPDQPVPAGSSGGSEPAPPTPPGGGQGGPGSSQGGQGKADKGKGGQSKGKGSAESDSPDPNDLEDNPEAEAEAEQAAKGKKGSADPSDPGKKAGRPPSTRTRATPVVTYASEEHTGAMLAFFLDRDTAEQLALDGAEVDGAEPADQLHLTLAYLGDAADLADPDTLKRAVSEFVDAYSGGALTGQVAGLGRFTPEGAEQHPVYASVDAPGLAEFRANLVAAVSGQGAEVDSTHGFTPHITLAYVGANDPTPITSVENVPLRFTGLTVALGGEYTTYSLESGESRGQRARLSPTERAALTRSMQALLAESVATRMATHTQDRNPHSAPEVEALKGEDEGSAKPRVGKPLHPSEARRKLRRRMATDLADYYHGHTPSHRHLEHVIETHRSNAVANSRHTWPPLAEAVGLLIEAREVRVAEGRGVSEGSNHVGVDANSAASPTSVEPTPEGEEPILETRAKKKLDKGQAEALRYSITKSLESEIPDYDPDLYDTVYGFRLDAYNLGGQEGLDAIGLGHFTFKLGDQDIIDMLVAYAASRVSSLLNTTRDQVANTILDGLLSGDDTSQIVSAVDTKLADTASYRADMAGQFEVDSAFYSGAQATWSRNGVEFNVWQTGPDPDPGAGATGETPCRDNSYAGAIPVGEAFPSGDTAPPAHNWCECVIAPSGDPADYANDSPWVGD